MSSRWNMTNSCWMVDSCCMMKMVYLGICESCGMGCIGFGILCCGRMLFVLMVVYFWIYDEIYEVLFYRYW